MTKNHSEAAGPIGPKGSARPRDSFDEPTVTLRTPAELADALPYLLGFKPEESIVLIALHGARGRFGGRVRLGVPERAEDWPCVAEQLAQCLVGGCERRGERPDGVMAFLCQEPAGVESARQVTERLRPLAQALRTACGRLDVPVFEVVCISEGRFWTYCCPDTRCCPPEGMPLLRPGTSVLAAAATYMGVQAGTTQSEIRGRLAPWQTAAAADQERALDAAGLTLIPRMLNDMDWRDEGSGAGDLPVENRHGEDEGVAAETLDLARRIMARLAAVPPVVDALDADRRDDELIAHDEAAALILGLQVRTTRDRAAEWMEGAEAPPALRLWRALARRCVGAYTEHAAAPLSLAGWVAWSLGSVAEGQEALEMALSADPGYAFALLLNQACNEDVDPESIRRCLRRERDGREEEGRREEEGGAAEAKVVDKAEETGATAESGGGAGEPGAEGEPDTAGDSVAAGEPGEAEGSGVSSGSLEVSPDVVPRRRRRRLPRTFGDDGRRSQASGGPRTFESTRTSGSSGTGPRNRRRTIRRSARDDR
ncbi:DUF4192 domain-containing protein [Streptomyces sp. NPDC058308]|uniref:DUF4192 domain-containing protein n=1 Tax=Streptomyces sp. NPDC058308 TaxID=3346440 RepID=UPI0036EA892D